MPRESYEEITPEFSQLLRIWWAFVWRNILVSIVAMLGGFCVGFVLGFIMGAVGVPLIIIKIVCGSMGFVLGVAFSFFPVKMVVGKDFGDFRLVVVKK